MPYERSSYWPSNEEGKDQYSHVGDMLFSIVQAHPLVKLQQNGAMNCDESKCDPEVCPSCRTVVWTWFIILLILI